VGLIVLMTILFDTHIFYKNFETLRTFILRAFYPTFVSYKINFFLYMKKGKKFFIFLHVTMVSSK